MKTRNKPLLKEVGDRYGAEKALTQPPPGMAKAMSCHALKDRIQSRIKQTASYLKRLAQVFNSLGSRVRSRRGLATVGLMLGRDQIAAAFKGVTTINAARISVAQKGPDDMDTFEGCLHAGQQQNTRRRPANEGTKFVNGRLFTNLLR